MRLRAALASLLLLTFACARSVQQGTESSDRPVLTATPVTTIPPTTTTIVVPPLSAYPVDVGWVTDLEDDSAERAAIELGLRISLATGIEGPSPFTVIAYRDEASLLNAWMYVSGDTLDEASERWETMQGMAYTTGHGWVIFVHVDQPDSDWFRRVLVSTTIHEWFHLHEYAATPGKYGGDRDRDAAPMWFTEGSADWFAYATMDVAGVPPLEGTPRDGLDYEIDPFPGLGAWESRDGFESDPRAYEASEGAVDLLVETVGCQAVLDDYWHGRSGYQGSWRDVFAYAFHMTVEEFYALVDEYVADHGRADRGHQIIRMS